MKVDFSIRGKQVLLEPRQITSTPGGILLPETDAATRVYVLKVGEEAAAAGFKPGDEIILFRDASPRLLTLKEEGKEYGILRTFEDIACTVARSLIDV